MIVSEQEAGTRRCQEGYAASPGASRNPEVDHVVVMQAVPAPAYGASVMGVASSNRPATAPIFCLGSACMAWRWAKQAPHELRVDGIKGYCGKAGAP